MNHRIELNRVTQYFPQGDTTLTLFKDVTYTFNQQETYALTGVSGTGKTTLLHILAGLEKPSSGSVWYDATNITELPEEKIRVHLQRHIGIIFQYAYLLNDLSVQENVEIKGVIAGLPEDVARDQAATLLKQVGLADKARMSPAALSGGEQQRVAIARALMLKPPFILADEPTAHLDEKTKQNVLELLSECQKLYGSAFIVSSHDPFIINQMQHTLTIHQGALCHG